MAARRAEHASHVDSGLTDARATLAEIWRRHEIDSMRKLTKNALTAVIEAEQTMRAADAWVSAKTPADKKKALRALQVCCSARVIPASLVKP